MSGSKYEDLIMKKAMELFADQGLKFLGINEKVKEIAPTELVKLELTNLNMDYIFLMEDDSYLHFEFQSTDKGTSDLRRFRAYEALYSHRTQKDVSTYVIYSGHITKPKTTLQTGLNRYHIRAITLADQNGDHLLETLKAKLQAGETLTNEDLMGLAFAPIMGGHRSQVEKIKQAVVLSHNIADTEIKGNIQSILFAFASKFLKGSDLENIKEAILMTQLGQMIYDDGIAVGFLKGEETGIQKGERIGIQKGERIGIQKGRQEGEQTGIQKGERQKSLFVATEAIRMGLGIETIVRLSSLSPAEIEELSKELAQV